MNIYKKPFISVLISALLLTLISCSFTNYSDSGSLIVDGKGALDKLSKGYVLLDAQRASSYAKEHIVSAVNIERNSIMIKTPVPNSLATGDIISEVAGRAGFKETSNLIIYDDNMNMDSSRLYWTLKIWGHTGDMLIVSGGLSELENAGLQITSEPTPVQAVQYRTSSLNENMIASKELILKMIDDPEENFVLIDVRTDEEYNAGTIPGSIHINHEKNLFVNEDQGTTFRPVSHNRILYKELGITPDCEIVLFCKSSVRAANSYAALYNAGYRNIKIYDGAWLEWVNEKLPVFKPDVKTKASVMQADNS